MAEGGYDNPLYDIDDTDLPDANMEPVGDVQRDILNHSDHLADLRGQLRESKLDDLKKTLVRTFYDEVGKRYGITPTELDYDQFKISDDGKNLYWLVGDKEIRLSAKKGGATFLSLNSLAKEYGSGGTLAIRQYLNLPEYNTSLSQKAISVLQNTRNNLPEIEEIPLQDLSHTTDEIETSLKTVETEFSHVGIQSEAGLTLRELQGLDKALQSIRGELTNNLAKLSDIDKDIAKEKQKLQEAGDDDKKRINDRIKNLEEEKSARLEAASANKEALRGQVNRIKETIDKVLNKDTTLAERIKTLFKEQGITIVSVLTAFGMIIGMLVEAFLPSSPTTPTPKKPDSKEGVKEWIKKQLSSLSNVLSKLAGKAVDALPGIIGSIVSWLLSTAGKAIGWLGNNLWALVVGIGGLLFITAREYSIMFS